MTFLFNGTLPAGTTLQKEKYIITEILGQGLFSVTYLASLPVLNKRVVMHEFFLKDHCFRDESGGVKYRKPDKALYDSFREKWFDEAKALAACSGHENMIEILDTFRENDTTYFVTEYFPGKDLHDYIITREGQLLKETEAISLIRQIASGIAQMHRNGILHLDLAPSKVLVGIDQRVVVVGFGIARKHIPPEILPETEKLSKPGFSPPELRETDGPCGQFSDIYSLGALLFFMLTGKTPPASPDRVKESLNDLRSSRLKISPQTCTTLSKALAFSPGNRYHEVNDFIQELPDGQATGNRVFRYRQTLAVFLFLFIAGMGSVIYYRFNESGKEPVTTTPPSGRSASPLSAKLDKTRGTVSLTDSVTREKIVLGNYHALLIGIDQYQDARYQSLDNPVNDVRQLGQILVRQYTFDAKDTIMLINPKKKEIFEALNYYRNNLTPDDNLFVFFAGHGRYDKEIDMGYMIPSDAEYLNEANWISFAELKKKFSVIPARHILLIADACYAGSVFRGDDFSTQASFNPVTIEQISRKSRNAFTSAYLKPVPDNSLFVRYLTATLRDNKKKLFLSEDLYIDIRNMMIRGTSVKDPIHWGVVQDCGDEGGDFLFVRQTDL